MALLMQNDLIRVTDTNGAIAFDTTRKMPILQNIFAGAMPMGSYSYQTGTNAWDIGGYDGRADFIFPTFQLSQQLLNGEQMGGPNGVPFNGTGSCVAYAKWTLTDFGMWLSGSRVLTIAMTANNRILLIEDYAEWGGDQPVPPCTVYYRVYVGRYS